MTDTMKHLHIHGHVQGVGYRWSMMREAERLGVRGWVRNRRDGSVEAMVAGTDQEVEAMVAWAKRGPPGATVARVDVSVGGEGAFEGFELLPTA